MRRHTNMYRLRLPGIIMLALVWLSLSTVPAQAQYFTYVRDGDFNTSALSSWARTSLSGIRHYQGSISHSTAICWRNRRLYKPQQMAIT